MTAADVEVIVVVDVKVGVFDGGSFDGSLFDGSLFDE
jgi:hypothetical protein